jgi:hypothetical protein
VLLALIFNLFIETSRGKKTKLALKSPTAVGHTASYLHGLGNSFLTCGETLSLAGSGWNNGKLWSLGFLNLRFLLFFVLKK